MIKSCYVGIYYLFTNDPIKDKLEDILVRTLYDNDQYTDPKISQAGFQIDNFSRLLKFNGLTDRQQQFENGL